MIYMLHTEPNNISVNNQYLSIFLDKYICAFRNFISSKFIVEIKGLAGFVDSDDDMVSALLAALEYYDFTTILSGDKKQLSDVEVCYTKCDANERKTFAYSLDNLVLLTRLSCETGISLMAILIMKIISKIISKHKIIYKAFILDLDDTLWPGTISEEGFESIRNRLRSPEGAPFVNFMCFVRAMAIEYGLFVAICSRNDEKEIKNALSRLKISEFPIKDQIDCIVANYSDKSINIKDIANELSIMTNACVFIDDNQINRDIVSNELPDVFVPQWSSINELSTLVEASCIFDRFELSHSSRNRKRIMKQIKQDREICALVNYQVLVHDDVEHKEAIRLYRNAGQFKFNNNLNFDAQSKSVYFELFRGKDESIGIAAALSFSISDNQLHVYNWAISCRFFCIGLEEFILIYLANVAAFKTVTFDFIESDHNVKAAALINKYEGLFSFDTNGQLTLVHDQANLHKLNASTKLRERLNG